MSRNLKKEYLNKLIKINVNGYKVDMENFIYNPSLTYEYPHLIKIISETETEYHYKSIGYMKYYDGSGEYLIREYNVPKGDGWHVTTNNTKRSIEKSKRFSLKRLQEIAEAE